MNLLIALLIDFYEMGECYHHRESTNESLRFYEKAVSVFSRVPLHLSVGML